MGIKHFFIWYRKHFGSCLDTINTQKNQSWPVETRIDTLCIDLNGVFHPAAQKIYKYGNFAPKQNQRLLSNKHKKGLSHQLKFFKEVCDKIEFYRNLVKPEKKIIICIDGVAGSAKMAQQRQRRFKTAKNCDTPIDFDPNCLTPGTKVMDFLSKYIDWYIRSMISYHPEWKNLEIVFSDEKTPGEGEHKIVNYMREYALDNEKICIHGMDADLIMLSIASQRENLYILRENMMNCNEFYILNITKFNKELVNYMRWDTRQGPQVEVDDVNQYQKDTNQSFRPKTATLDFVFICFLVGNDFLPTLPALAILEGGIDSMIDVYKDVGKSYGHITKISRKDKTRSVTFNTKALQVFLGTLAQYEKGFLEEKLSKINEFIADPLLSKHSTNKYDKDMNDTKLTYTLNFESYKSDYYTTKFPSDTDTDTICGQYIRGMEWVLTYYYRGIPDWKWFYPYFYGPFLCDLTQFLDNHTFDPFPRNKPILPFIQLLSVLPPQSAQLLPFPCDRILTSQSSPLQKYYPDDFEVDCSGKRKEWEGIVILPMIDLQAVGVEYDKCLSNISEQDLKRNIANSSKIYNYNERYFNEFRSFHGNIPECKTKITQIDL